MSVTRQRHRTLELTGGANPHRRRGTKRPEWVAIAAPVEWLVRSGALFTQGHFDLHVSAFAARAVELEAAAVLLDDGF